MKYSLAHKAFQYQNKSIKCLGFPPGQVQAGTGTFYLLYERVTFYLLPKWAKYCIQAVVPLQNTLPTDSGKETRQVEQIKPVE
eukprot:c25498_g1_i1 orf=140-388(+)